MILGFLGTGHITSSVIEGIFRSKLKIKKIYLSPRNVLIAKKLSKRFKKIIIAENNQQLIDSIYAIGDCTNFVYGSSNIRLESIQNAVDQSKIAALNILNIKDKYLPLPWFWTDQFDLKLQIVGLNTSNNDNQNIRTLGSKSDLKFSNFISSVGNANGQIKGLFSLGKKS